MFGPSWCQESVVTAVAFHTDAREFGYVSTPLRFSNLHSKVGNSHSGIGCRRGQARGDSIARSRVFQINREQYVPKKQFWPFQSERWVKRWVISVAASGETASTNAKLYTICIQPQIRHVWRKGGEGLISRFHSTIDEDNRRDCLELSPRTELSPKESADDPSQVTL